MLSYENKGSKSLVIIFSIVKFILNYVNNDNIIHKTNVIVIFF